MARLMQIFGHFEEYLMASNSGPVFGKEQIKERAII